MAWTATHLLLAALLLLTTTTAQPRHRQPQIVDQGEGEEGQREGISPLRARSGERNTHGRHGRHWPPHHGNHDVPPCGGRGRHGPPRHGPPHHKRSVACRRDLEVICPGIQGPAVVHNCLDTAKVSKLSATCRKEEPCLEYAVRFCSHAFGPRNHHNCMKGNLSHFSPTCQAELTHREHGHHKRMRGGHHGAPSTAGEEDGPCDGIHMMREQDRPFQHSRGPHMLFAAFILLLTLAAGVVIGRNCCRNSSSNVVSPEPQATSIMPTSIVTASAVPDAARSTQSKVASAPPSYSQILQIEQPLLGRASSDTQNDDTALQAAISKSIADQ